MIVSFFGHRKIEITEELCERLKQTIENLILDGVDTFLFGSRSEFDNLCFSVVCELKQKYPNIKRISYNAPSETVFTSKAEAEHFEEIELKLFNKKVYYEYFEQKVDSEKSYKANKNAYIARNQEMIDASDICIFYYDKNYLPPKRKNSKRDLLDYQPKSGTAIAFAYAKQKKKKIINVYEGSQAVWLWVIKDKIVLLMIQIAVTYSNLIAF